MADSSAARSGSPQLAHQREAASAESSRTPHARHAKPSVASAGSETVAAEASFPFLIWIRRLNPLVLLVMCLMHVGIFLMMNVGPFSFVALAAYPALLHPTYAERIHGRLRR